MKYAIAVSGNTVWAVACVRNVRNPSLLNVATWYVFVGRECHRIRVGSAYPEKAALEEFNIVARGKDGAPWRIYGDDK